ncbi:MAG TPA: threonine--tRNA ligase [Candidatus Dormibacteraeota bacterium]
MPPNRTAEAAADPVNMLRHSAAHILAAAVLRLHPDAKYVVGPYTEEPPGFFYEFDLDRPLNEEDLKAIETEMRRIVKESPPFEHVFLPRAEAIEEFRRLGQDYKVDLIERKVPEEGGEGADGGEVSLYRTGDFVDLCRGPHVEKAGDLRAFKLQRVSGAYLWGDEKLKQLQRVWGTAWPTKDELAKYLEFLEEAERRDHKRLGRELKLFMVDERVGAGLPIWLPNGATIRRELERFIVDEEVARGYLHVRTPDVARMDLYRESGHAEKFVENMYPPMVFEDGEELELRPVNCPHHIVVYQSELRSYRDLPLRIAEIGNNWRYERSGTLIGLNRVRVFALNDSHIFCTPEQIQEEVRGAIELALFFSEVLGIEDFWYRLSTRDLDASKRLGTDAEWDRAEKALADALESLGQKFQIGEGEAAFYGPKIDFQVKDAHRREFTNSTVQVDFQLPERFGLEYVAEDGSRQRPVMVHRGAAGSMERLFSYLIERYAGAFPTWLHPVQVAVIPITDDHIPYADGVAAELRERGLRVEVDRRAERMQKKIREWQRQKVPYMAVVGDREAEARRVSVRDRAGAQTDEPLDEFIGRVALEVRERRR